VRRPGLQRVGRAAAAPPGGRPPPLEERPGGDPPDDRGEEIMTLHLWLVNLAAYSAQIAIVVAAGAALPRLLRIRRPDALLVYRQTLLAACLLLPWAQPWRRPALDFPSDVSIRTETTLAAEASGTRGLSIEEAAALLLGA